MYRFIWLIGFCWLIQLPLGAQSGFLEETAEKWENAMAYTLELAEAVPDSLYTYRPTPEQMSFQEQLLHMAGNVAWLTSDYLFGDSIAVDRKMEGAPRSEVLAVLHSAMQAAHRALQNFPADKLTEEVSFFAGPKTRRQMILLLHDHLTHHRGQLIVYARLQGISPPRYRGW